MAANPCVQATKPKVSSNEIEPPPPEWVRKIIGEAESVNDDLAVCLRLAAAPRRLAGFRVGLELLRVHPGLYPARRVRFANGSYTPRGQRPPSRNPGPAGADTSALSGR